MRDRLDDFLPGHIQQRNRQQSHPLCDGLDHVFFLPHLNAAHERH
jgi:hypothetical protein